LPCSRFSTARTATTATSTLSLHDALPIFRWEGTPGVEDGRVPWRYRHARFLKLLGSKTVHVLDSWRVETLGELDEERGINTVRQDRKSTRLNSSHVKISYAVFCLKQKKNR